MVGNAIDNHSHLRANNSHLRYVPGSWQLARRARRRISRRFLFGDDDALGGVGVVFTHKGKATRPQRTQPNHPVSTAGNHLLDFERGGVELFGGRVGIGDGEYDRLTLRHMDFRRRELMVFYGDRDVQHIVRTGRRRPRETNQESRDRDDRTAQPVAMSIDHPTVLSSPINVVVDRIECAIASQSQLDRRKGICIVRWEANSLVARSPHSCAQPKKPQRDRRADAANNDDAGQKRLTSGARAIGVPFKEPVEAPKDYRPQDGRQKERDAVNDKLVNDVMIRGPIFFHRQTIVLGGIPSGPPMAQHRVIADGWSIDPANSQPFVWSQHLSMTPLAGEARSRVGAEAFTRTHAVTRGACESPWRPPARTVRLITDLRGSIHGRECLLPQGCLRKETDMRIATAALFATGLAVFPLSGAKADCSNPLAFPFCVAGAAVNTAAAIATAPLYAVSGGPYYYSYPYYYGSPYYYGAGYYYYHHHRRYYHRHY
jgi:hypothetical protein